MATTLHIRRTWDGVPIPDVDTARVYLELEGADLLIDVEAPFHADPPPPGAPGPTDGLWNYEVVEVFIAGTGEGPALYTEIELSPHGHHLVLQLQGVRRVVRQGLPLDYRVTRADGRWCGRARLARKLLPPPPYRVNAYAIHGQGEKRRHLSAHPVPGEAPDFHRLEFFQSFDP